LIPRLRNIIGLNISIDATCLYYFITDILFEICTVAIMLHLEMQIIISFTYFDTLSSIRVKTLGSDMLKNYVMSEQTFRQTPNDGTGSTGSKCFITLKVITYFIV